ncbi:hypothetical protein [Brachybacterium sp. FME24]|uniref:hypothetical protein n=1 Tax=Brachybacterium sp. FME24 TaxID=2742605 RepID=UPI001865B43D|nr:hypothetical protein [Brachybacterium sp. FME24]
MLDSFRRRRRLRRARPGDGSALRDYRPWQLFTRTLFTLELEDEERGASVYAVDVHFMADELDDLTEDSLDDLTEDSSKRSEAPPVALYRDGAQLQIADPPVAFAVPGGAIEVATSLYGLSRMRYTPEDAPARTLTPHRWSLEGWRARFGRRFPRTSAAVGILAILVLLVGLVLGVPQIAEVITQIDLVAEHVGTFTSPVSLPVWANAMMLFAGILAATERALTLRHHWLIDADTTWTSLA